MRVSRHSPPTLLEAIAAHYPEQPVASLWPINDIKGGVRFTGNVVRFEIDEQDFASYQRAAIF
jgi:hypothetical protein